MKKSNYIKFGIFGLQILAIIGLIWYYQIVIHHFLILNAWVWYQNGSDFFAYQQFVNAFPTLYVLDPYCNCYLTAYLPQFYWFFVFFAKMQMYDYFQLMVWVNSIAYVIAFSIATFKKNPILMLIILMTSTCSIFAVLTWGNMEAIIYLVMAIITFAINDKNTKYLALVYSFFLFKMMAIIFIPIILLRLKEKRNRYQFIIISIITLIVLNGYFVIVNPQLLNLSYVYSILSHTNFVHTSWSIDYFYIINSTIHRETSVALGICLLLYLLSKIGIIKLWKKYHKQFNFKWKINIQVFYLIGIGIFVLLLYIFLMNPIYITNSLYIYNF